MTADDLARAEAERTYPTPEAGTPDAHATERWLIRRAFVAGAAWQREQVPSVDEGAIPNMVTWLSALRMDTPEGRGRDARAVGW